jgi:hypothetical protein
MPTIIRAGRLRIAIYFNDHGPAHVHVLGAGGEAKIGLDVRGRRPRLLVNDGMTQADLAVALRVVDAQGSLLRRKWKEIHGEILDPE